MKLIGNFLSPFVRRVAVSLHALAMPFEMDTRYVFQDPEAVRKHNPVVRIPTLVLDDGEVLVESYAILDAIDQMVGPTRCLTPAAGKARRQVMRATAIGLASMEKAQWAFYEGRFRPAEKIHQPWIDHNEAQVTGGLGYLDALAEAAGQEGWLAGTAGISQADITGVTGYSFAQAVRPDLAVADKAPHLAEFAARCEAMAMYRAAPIPD